MTLTILKSSLDYLYAINGKGFTSSALSTTYDHSLIMNSNSDVSCTKSTTITTFSNITITSITSSMVNYATPSYYLRVAATPS
jgi:hypothetical protein